MPSTMSISLVRTLAFILTALPYVLAAKKSSSSKIKVPKTKSSKSKGGKIGKLSKGAAIAIIVAVIVVVLLILTIIACIFIKRKRSMKKRQAMLDTEHSGPAAVEHKQHYAPSSTAPSTNPEYGQYAPPSYPPPANAPPQGTSNDYYRS
ncbi:hypothetical protein BJ508DRAFT_418987 [Ascobolus immersus RN42]|uniref:Mid2 domain-containing protein n=1 Tax=Ascobolus immersus RN42 TaxID=1160509 RepID=A0A3N4HM05_ASCIM|nr:hypothetical protein BJ508DRAFT_418987 [Ascobolus immersus RN42]